MNKGKVSLVNFSVFRRFDMDDSIPGVITKGSQIINADGDLALHVAVGNYILDTGKIPLEDVFSHTMNGLPYTPHEWLSEVLFAISNRIMGLDGAILLTALVISFAFWLTYKNSSRRSGSFFALLFLYFWLFSHQQSIGWPVLTSLPFFCSLFG